MILHPEHRQRGIGDVPDVFMQVMRHLPIRHQNLFVRILRLQAIGVVLPHEGERDVIASA